MLLKVKVWQDETFVAEIEMSDGAGQYDRAQSRRNPTNGSWWMVQIQPAKG